jgi:hypothetical protein
MGKDKPDKRDRKMLMPAGQKRTDRRFLDIKIMSNKTAGAN